MCRLGQDAEPSGGGSGVKGERQGVRPTWGEGGAIEKAGGAGGGAGRARGAPGKSGPLTRRMRSQRRHPTALATHWACSSAPHFSHLPTISTCALALARYALGAPLL